MSWNALANRGLTVKPFASPKPADGGKFSPFSASLSKTLTLLAREMEMLGAKNIVIELDVDDRDIRLDGYPRANARVHSAAIAISFESRFGPLRYATNEYHHWEDNLRAVALAMQALRAVDRYGVSKRGEQYQGWKALPRSTDPADLIETEADALAVLEEFGSGDVKAAIRATHPDHGGSTDDFRRVTKAREVLGV